jgi:hypothetical protein
MMDGLRSSVLHVANALAELDAAAVRSILTSSAIDSTTPTGSGHVVQCEPVFGLSRSARQLPDHLPLHPPHGPAPNADQCNHFQDTIPGALMLMAASTLAGSVRCPSFF